MSTVTFDNFIPKKETHNQIHHALRAHVLVQATLTEDSVT